MLRTLVVGVLTLVFLLAASGQAQAAGPATVFLERSGGTLHAGWDNGAARTSSLLAGRGIDRLAVPAFAGSDAAWRATVTCVRARFAQFAVNVVDQRPSGGAYATLMVGGSPSLIGYSKSVSGVAPYNGDRIPTAIAFVFSDLLDSRPSAVCESAAHEIGHTLGLDHVRTCEDLMSYGHGCGAKSFVDQTMVCGEYSDRDCANGQPRQNSYQMLVEHLGLRETAEPPPVAEPEPEPEPEADFDRQEDPDTHDWGDTGDTGDWGETEGQPDWDQDDWDQDETNSMPTPRSPAPGVCIDEIEVEQRWQQRGQRTVQISVHADAAEFVELAWARGDDVYLFRCDALPADAPVTCEQRGRVSVFTLTVGRGQRAYAVRATGADGTQVVTEPRALRK